MRAGGIPKPLNRGENPMGWAEGEPLLSRYGCAESSATQAGR